MPIAVRPFCKQSGRSVNIQSNWGVSHFASFRCSAAVPGGLKSRPEAGRYVELNHYQRRNILQV